MKKLISMTDYVLDLADSNNVEHYLKLGKLIEYAEFLTQPLKLEMFVPCDEDGNVLEEPRGYEIFKEGIKEGGTVVWAVQCKEYQQALKKVLFKGFKSSDEYLNAHCVSHKNIGQITFLKKVDAIHPDDKYQTIQDLVHLDLELTENCKI